MPYISAQGDIRRDGDARNWRDGRSGGEVPFNKRPTRVALTVLAALGVAFVLNPSHASLSTFLAHRTSGSIVANLARTFAKETYTRKLLFSEASSGGDRFVGVAGFWFEDPRARLQATRLAHPPSVVELLAAAFLAVFAGWCVLPYGTMQTHFTLSRRGAFSEGRYYTLVTIAVSHAEPLHLLLNLATLLSVGPEVEARLGSRRFAALYALAALVGSAASLAGHLNGHYRSLGGSGALFGLSGYLATTAAQHHQVLLYGVAMSPTQALVASLVLGAGLARNNGGTDNWMHAGGALAGAVAFPKLLALRLAWL
jgi:membrane associated rhomboid family serine protease